MNLYKQVRMVVETRDKEHAQFVEAELRKNYKDVSHFQ